MFIFYSNQFIWMTLLFIDFTALVCKQIGIFARQTIKDVGINMPKYLANQIFYKQVSFYF